MIVQTLVNKNASNWKVDSGVNAMMVTDLKMIMYPVKVCTLPMLFNVRI